jgi:hypothetical protein
MNHPIFAIFTKNKLTLDIQSQELTEINELKKKAHTPWKYRESFLVMLLLLCVGLLFEFLTKNKGIPLPQMPFSLYIGVMFGAGIIVLHINYRNTPLLLWLSGIPAAISAIIGYIACLLCLGLIPQKTEYSGILHDLGLSHIKTSYLFIMVQVYLLSTLGFAILRRILPIRLKNIGFFFCHVGLWLTIASAGLGAGDLKRLNINLLENEKESNVGLSANDEMYKLPFTVKLLDFTIEEYDPTIVIMDNKRWSIRHDTPKPLPSAEAGSVFKYKHWYIYITKYIPNAIFADSTFRPTDLPGSYSSAYLEVVDITQRKKRSGWISNGNLYQEPQYFTLDSSCSVALSLPQPKKYYSKLSIKADSTYAAIINLEVNKPFSIKKWKLYQNSYDLSKGKWSTLSVLEAVRDPWLPAVYTGLAMLFIGTVLMIWTRKIKQK